MTASHGGSPVLKRCITSTPPLTQPLNEPLATMVPQREMGGVVRCHTARMPSEDPFAPPENPKPGQNWVDEAGDLYMWDGTDWVPFEDIPFFKPSQSFKDL